MADIVSLEGKLPSVINEDIPQSDLPLKDRFFRYFQQEITGMSMHFRLLSKSS